MSHSGLAESKNKRRAKIHDLTRIVRDWEPREINCAYTKDV